jgi:hypothetical protein
MSAECKMNNYLYVRLGSGSDTGHGETDVDGGTNTTEKELRFQEDLTVSNGDDLRMIRMYMPVIVQLSLTFVGM